MTASRAISKPDLVAPETAARVRASAERLAYVPNRVAGGLSSQKSHVVIGVIPSTLNPVFSEMVEALRGGLLSSGYELFLGLSEYASRRETELIEAVISRRPDAIVLTGVVHSPAVRWRLERAHIPVVETWDLTPSPIDMLVGFSNQQVGRNAAEHLLARKRRKLGLIMADDQRSLLRREGFCAALEERGRSVSGEIILHAPSTLGSARDGARRLLASNPDIDAIFCSSDQIAMGVLYEASARGLPVPDRLAVVGFGNLVGSAHTHPALTTVAVDGARVGREAARLLLERLEGKAPGARKDCIIDVGSYVLPRESS